MTSRPTTLEGVLLAVIVLFAAAARLQPLVKSPELQRSGYGQFGDTLLYHLIAVNLWRGHGFSATDDGTAFGGPPIAIGRYEPAITRPPVYPIFLAAVYSFVGNANDTTLAAWRRRWDAARFTQGVLDALTGILVFFLARALAPSSAWPPLAAAAIYAISPYNIFYTRALLSECVGTFLMTAGLLLCVIAVNRGRRVEFLVAGVMLGVAALCNPQVVLFPLFLGGWILWRHATDRATSLALALCLLAGTALSISPWAMRNLILFHQPIPISMTSPWYSIFLGSYETRDTWQGWNVVPAQIVPDPQERAAIAARFDLMWEQFNRGSLAVSEIDRGFRPLALGRIRDHPAETLGAWIDGAQRLWYQHYIVMYRDAEASGRYVLLYFALAIYAAVRAASSERRMMVPIGLFAVYLTVIFLPLHDEARYSVIAMPGVIAVAGVGLARFLNDANEWRLRTSTLT